MPRVFIAARLPDGGEFTFRLSLTDSADPSGGNRRHPFDDKTLAFFDELRTPLLRNASPWLAARRSSRRRSFARNAGNPDTANDLRSRL
jgi:hypothetical protein